MLTTKGTKMTQGAKGLALAAVLIAVLVFAAAAFASGSGPAIAWWVFGGGGGGAGGGNVALDGTLGQPVTGVSYGGGVVQCAGYWCGEQPRLVFLPMLRR